MQNTTNYNLKKPDEATDFYDVNDFNDNMDILDAKLKEVEDESSTSSIAISGHTSNKSNPHGVTKSQIGLSSVPNVSTNNQTPTYTLPSEVQELSSGEKLSVAFGKIAKAVSQLKSISSQVLYIDSFDEETGALVTHSADYEG